MNWNFDRVITALQKQNKHDWLLSGYIGLEREAQRITEQGELALTPHPTAFGDKLTNAQITTDFSESQLELVTRPHPTVERAWNELKNIHYTVEHGINEELLWPFSTPPILPEEKDIPIAKFTDSELGRKKEIYRRGLAVRYGKKRQMISGVHYNFSFGDEIIKFLYDRFGVTENWETFKNDLYFKTARNFLRYRWLLIYLFGASPVNHSSYNSAFIRQSGEREKQISSELKLYQQYATSVRVSRLGYSNHIEQQSLVSYNQLNAYASDLKHLLHTPSEDYQKLGMFQNNEQVQLNTNLLQDESEFYTPIRLKSRDNEVDKLAHNGVDYLEIRIFDNNPFEKTGVSREQLYFIQLFLLVCLFEESPSLSTEQMKRLNTNHNHVALMGRKPHLKLLDENNNTVYLTDWANDIFGKMKRLATEIDRTAIQKQFYSIVNDESKKIANSALLPSEQVVCEMKKNKESYIDLGLRLAKFFKHNLSYDKEAYHY